MASSMTSSRRTIPRFGRTNPPFCRPSPQFIGGNTTEVGSYEVRSRMSLRPGSGFLFSSCFGSYRFQPSKRIPAAGPSFGLTKAIRNGTLWQKVKLRLAEETPALSAFRNLNASPGEWKHSFSPIHSLGANDYYTNLEYGKLQCPCRPGLLKTSFPHGLTFSAAFTWSKSLDNITSGDASGAPGDPRLPEPLLLYLRLRPFGI